MITTSFNRFQNDAFFFTDHLPWFQWKINLFNYFNYSLVLGYILIIIIFINKRIIKTEFILDGNTSFKFCIVRFAKWEFYIQSKKWKVNQRQQKWSFILLQSKKPMALILLLIIKVNIRRINIPFINIYRRGRKYDRIKRPPLLKKSTSNYSV